MKYIALILISTFLIRCSSDDANTVYIPPSNPDISHPNDQYLYNRSGLSLFERFGTATRWRWNDNFIRPDQRATPVRSDLVIPVSRVVNHLWIGPYENSGAGGTKLMKDLFPPELVFIGSFIYNDDGTRLLGFAEGGARVTLLDLNSYNLQNEDWFTNPGNGILTTIHHEFGHIIHQKYGMPVGFNTISTSYLGNGWSNGVTLADAIKKGMVRNYGTKDEFEDFCEIISHFLVVKPATFNTVFINQQDCSTLTTPAAILNCQELNNGRLLIKKKLDMITQYYMNNFNIDLYKVRDILQTRLNNVITTGVIPD